MTSDKKSFRNRAYTDDEDLDNVENSEVKTQNGLNRDHSQVPDIKIDFSPGNGHRESFKKPDDVKNGHTPNGNGHVHFGHQR